MQDDFWNKMGKVHVRRMISDYNSKKQRSSGACSLMERVLKSLAIFPTAFRTYLNYHAKEVGIIPTNEEPKLILQELSRMRLNVDASHFLTTEETSNRLAKLDLDDLPASLSTIL